MHVNVQVVFWKMLYFCLLKTETGFSHPHRRLRTNSQKMGPNSQFLGVYTFLQQVTAQSRADFEVTDACDHVNPKWKYSA